MRCFAYTRVSTTKQRDQGASLEAQRAAIERYAAQHGLTITEWFTEARTAGKRGRAKFTELIRRLKKGQAQGVIVHKIDRSARNLRDWSDFVSLTERGITIHVAGESLDLNSRGGRLSADIQAVVASDYIRNLKQEAMKGIQARYAQGLLPRQAPVGYLDNGAGKPKTIDPVKGPLVRELFERYATGCYGVRSLGTTMNSRGLTNQLGRPLSKNTISGILNQPFYTGVIFVKKTGETFPGQHQALISKSLFQRCQDVSRGRVQRTRAIKHAYVFSRLVRCGECGHKLIGECQKGHVYYRCHTKGCSIKCKREELLDQAMHQALSRVRLTKVERKDIEAELETILGLSGERRAARNKVLDLEIAQVNERIGRLTDLVIDGVIGKNEYAPKREAMQEKLAKLERERARQTPNADEIRQQINSYLELAQTAQQSFESESKARKRRIIQATTSNLTATAEGILVEPSFPFSCLMDTGVSGLVHHIETNFEILTDMNSEQAQ